jgi:SAM-dependent methyltransferase
LKDWLNNARFLTAMNESRKSFRRWTECLLDPGRAAGEQREAAHAWCQWGLDLLEVNEHETVCPGTFFSNTTLAGGTAISPLSAARCLRDFRRTAVFLQAMDAALRAAFQRFPGETIHVLEAGCGPLAPLALPFALRYSPEKVMFTLLDVHPAALDAAQHVADKLGLLRSIRAFVANEATSVRFAEGERPHVIACEMLQAALTSEPQVAATLNLAPQLRTGGFYLPEQIDVDAVLFDSGAHLRAVTNHSGDAALATRALTELGNAFSLQAHALDRLDSSEPGRLAGATIHFPSDDGTRRPSHLFTRISVFREHRLMEFESDITLPQRVKYPATLARGGKISFSYEVAEKPGLRLRND